MHLLPCIDSSMSENKERINPERKLKRGMGERKKGGKGRGEGKRRRKRKKKEEKKK